MSFFLFYFEGVLGIKYELKELQMNVYGTFRGVVLRMAEVWTLWVISSNYSAKMHAFLLCFFFKFWNQCFNNNKLRFVDFFDVNTIRFSFYPEFYFTFSFGWLKTSDLQLNDRYSSIVSLVINREKCGWEKCKCKNCTETSWQRC